MSVKDISGEVAFLARELKTPVIGESFVALADQARDQGWSPAVSVTAALRQPIPQLPILATFTDAALQIVAVGAGGSRS